MRKFYLLGTLVLTILLCSTTYAQDFSNKGKDFYLCFPAHVPNTNNATLSIWITSDKASSGTITMGNGAYSNIFNIAANGLVEIQVPWAAAHISNAESNVIGRKSIRVKVDAGRPAVVVYAQQWAGARSAATLVLPTNVLGKKYYSVNFTQNSGGRSQFDIIAIKDNTVVTITPRVNGLVGTPFNVTFPLAGDIYQYQVTGANAGTADLTGTFIESIASSSGGCLPIAVFSGASTVSIGTNLCGNPGSSDPLLQQQYPVSTWGKNFGFMPFRDYNGNPYRVLASEDNTSVYFDGIQVAILNAGQIYPAAFTTFPILIFSPTSITANKPICVAQYAQSSACTGQTPPLVGDPDMVILNPIEQNIRDITIFSSSLQNISRQYINVLIKTNDTISFTINAARPNTAWQLFPSLPGYSYLRHQLPGAGSYRLNADSSFNAICYGFGNVESYAYSAGTNVKDLYQQIGVSTEFGIETTPSVCTNSPFRFKVSLPYCADSLVWDLSGLPGPPLPTFDTIRYSSCTPGAGGPDSTTVVNGVTIYWYSLPRIYSFGIVGTFPVTITAFSPNTDGCGSEQEINFDLQVSIPPVADFSWSNSGCVAEPVQFTETTPQIPKTTYHFWWNFGDPASGVNDTSNLRNPTHTFTNPGIYTVRFSDITTPGCLSDTIQHFVTVAPLPSATISGTTTVCVNTAPPNITFTGTGGTPPYTFTYTINGGAPLTVGSVGTSTTATVAVPTTTAGVYVYNLVSVKNTGSTLCTQNIVGQSATVTVNPDHAITLTSGGSTTNQAVCVNTLIIPITYNLSGGATGAIVTGLPPGVTSSVTGTTLTISGAPTTGVGSPFNYSIITTGNSCLTASANGMITVNPDHTITLTSPGSTTNQSVCLTTAIAPITYDLSGGATGATVTGLPPGVTASVAGTTLTIIGTPTTTVGSPFNYSITTTGNSCLTASASGTIAVDPGHTVTLSSAPSTTNQAVCINTMITPITYTLGGGANGGTVTGLPPGVTSSVTGTTLTIIGSPTTIVGSPFNYSISTTGNSCLSASASGTITVNPDHTITLSSAGSTTNQAVCKNTAIAPITYTLAGGANGATVTGLPAGVTSSVSGTTLTIIGTPTTAVGSPFNYSITTTGNGCVTATANGTITVYQLPTADFNFTAPSCETRTITFTDVSTPNSGSLSTWQWDFGDPGSGPANTSALRNPTHVFANAGLYNVKLTVTTDKGCVSAILTKPVTINERPKSGFISPEVCLTDPLAPFVDTSRIAAGSIVAWNWNFGDPNATPPNPNTSTLRNPFHRYSVVGAYTATLVATSNNGCKDTIQQTFTVNGSIPVAGFTVQNPASLCSNQSVSITDASTVDFGSLVNVEIYWDYLNNPTIKTTDTDPVPGEMYTHTYPEFGTPFTKTYRVRYVAYSGINCVNSTTRDITIMATPTLQFGPVPFSCDDAPAFQVTQAQLLNGLPGAGVFSGPGITPSGVFSPSIAGVGLHTIRYTYTGANGCTNYKEQTIAVYTGPPVNAGPDKFMLEGGQVTLTPALNAGMPVTYLWSPPQYLSDPTIAFTIASPPDDKTYTLTVTTDKGCSNSDAVFIKVLKAPAIPNIFSPNGDGIHDRWVIAYLESYPGCTIDVYNRYGQLVYHSVGYTTPWDGKVNGKDVPVGTYYYIVDPKNGRTRMAGYVDVIR